MMIHCGRVRIEEVLVSQFEISNFNFIYQIMTGKALRRSSKRTEGWA
jgi:hypothetical protein